MIILQTKRNAFSLYTAIIVIILMSTVAMLVVSTSGKMVKETTAQFQKEQAALYANSFTEYAILAVTGNDRSVDCLQTINSTIGTPAAGNGFQVRTHISYIVNGTVDISNCDGIRILSSSVTTADTPMTIIVDAYVDYKEPDHYDSANAPWMTYHKRTVQKI